MKEREAASISKKITLVVIISLSCFSVIAIVLKPVYALPKPLFVIADLRAPGVGNPVSVYDIQQAPTYLVYRKTQNVPIHGSGAVGLAIDSESKTLFITYESSNIIQLINITTFADLGTAIIPGASNLAGIVYDHDKRLIYTVDRRTDNLYVYRWDAVTHVLTLESHVNLANTSRAYGIALDETNNILYVADEINDIPYITDREYIGCSDEFDWYDTDTWAHVGSKTTTHAVVGIAVDAKNRFVYTSGGWFDYGLYKYNMTTDTETAILNGKSGIYADVLGVAVDQNSSLVYVTTYGDGSTGYTDVLMVFDSNLNELWRSGDIGNPTGIAIPIREFSYNPPGSSIIEYWVIATLGLVGCFTAFGVFCIFKRKKRRIDQTENAKHSFLSQQSISRCIFWSINSFEKSPNSALLRLFMNFWF